ncbi:Uncharacterised protein [Vibrio metschnikovii]|uniref:hypothetical protein n=1 Tax=Vibrio TaxID=662 RepID=UPI0002D54B7D|nr:MULTISPECIES: hypothetical protein [Vibrio]EKO3565260.1 hypothetical protein [Vibrio metschnikovii]EKO3769467.1 hypothetical protein [Vibrio metschnikovii]NNN83038.1 hypothetical protein [Vibrio sp. A8-1]SUP50007.1 Uncharacterised protein [Vibrio metschnikovii]SUQ09964.1 Uncharacterised protein [Vibrio metschnikovii]
MLERITYFFWLAFLALLLPSQALACAENYPTSSITLNHSVLDTASHSVQNPFEFDSQESPIDVDSVPTSDTLAKSITQAILNPPRLQLTEINLPLDNGFDFPHLEGNHALPRFIDAESYAAQTWISIPYQHFHASHRLSGWKETNAMYVALNSHFLSA